MARVRYPSDLTDAQWGVLEPLIPAVKSGGRPAIHDRREIMDAILYVLRTGCSWRSLPHDFPSWKTVYDYFRLWRLDETWERVNEQLRVDVRVRVGRQRDPTAAILDSQSTKSTEKGNPVAMMVGKRSTDESGTSWWIRRDCC
jgi:putative transposase